MAKQMHDPNVLESEHVGKLLFKLATPAFFGMFVQTLYNVINTIFMGYFVNPLAIGGLSIVFPIQMLAWGIGMMVGMGGSSLISRSIGSGNTEDAERTIGNGISLGFILSILLMIMVLPFVNFWLRLIGASDEVLPYANIYLIVIISATCINSLATTLLNFSRAEGNARVGMIAMIMGAVLSIILDAIFVIPLQMGAFGAALATVISQTASLLYLLSYYLTGGSYLKIRLRYLSFKWSILKQMLAIGVSSFAQTVSGSLSSMLVIRMVVNYGGDSALNAFGIIQRVMMFATMPAMVLGQAVQPILGYNYGAKRYHLALKAIKITVIASTSFSTLAFAALYLIPGPIMHVFTSDISTIDAGISASRLIFLSMPMMGAVMVGQTLFQAIGRAVPAFILALGRSVLFLIPIVLLFSHFWQLSGVFLSFPMADILTLILAAGLAVPVFKQFRKKDVLEKKGIAEPVALQQIAKTTGHSDTTK